MIVLILADTDYEPQPGDSMRCYGQLRMHTSTMEAEADGKKKTVCGPMVPYFPKGATPELADEVAAKLIAEGAAEEFDLDVKYVTMGEIIKDMEVPK